MTLPHTTLRTIHQWFGALAIAAGATAAVCAAAPPNPAGSRAEAVSDDPVVRAMLAIKPGTPSEIFRAATILFDAGEPALARPLVEQLMAKKLDDQVMAELIDEVGSAELMRLGRAPALQPAAGQFVSAALSGAQRFARDPVRLARLVRNLAAATPYEHAIVVEQLRPGGDASVAALVAALADPQRAAEHAAIRDTLVEMGAVASRPLEAVLDSADPKLVASTIDVLGRLRDPAVADRLLAPAIGADSRPPVREAAQRAVAVYFGGVPSPAQGAERLQRSVGALRAKIEKTTDEPGGDAGDPPLEWRWDDKTKQLTSKPVTQRAADLAAAVRAAAAARRILPDSQAVRRQYLSTLAQSVAEAGLAADARADVAAARAVLSGASLEDLEDLLAVSLDDNRPGPAAVAAQLLGERGDPSLLNKRTPQPAPLVRALAHPDRALRFAALGAIMRLNPRQPFPGASRVPEALAFFARSSGTPRALAGAASAAEAGRLAGALAEVGYEPDAATSPTEVLRLAQTSADYEVIFVDTALALPVSGQLLQRLRADSRSAKIPVGIVSLGGDDLKAAERLALRVPLCAAVTRTHNAAATEFALSRLFAATGRAPVGRDERQQQGLKALGWIAALAGERRPLYDLRSLDATVAADLDAPGMTEAAITALAALDTPLAQRTLVNLASRLAAPVAVREAAVQAFADSVARCGTLLTGNEILRQYDRYNASETQSVETQKVLSRILDTIEARAQAEALTQGGAARVGG